MGGALGRPPSTALSCRRGTFPHLPAPSRTFPYLPVPLPGGAQSYSNRTNGSVQLFVSDRFPWPTISCFTHGQGTLPSPSSVASSAHRAPSALLQDTLRWGKPLLGVNEKNILRAESTTVTRGRATGMAADDATVPLPNPTTGQRHQPSTTTQRRSSQAGLYHPLL